MTRATTIALSAVMLFILATGVVHAQGAYGIVLYNGPTSADIYFGKLTDPQYSRVEYYRGSKKIGEITYGGPDGGIYTDQGLTSGTSWQYFYRAWYASGGTYRDGDCASVLKYRVTGGMVAGILTRYDEIAADAELTDSLFIVPEGYWLLKGVYCPGGELKIKSGKLTYDPTFAGKILGIKLYQNADSLQRKPGKFTASGGTLRDLNLTGTGQAGPIDGLAFIASDIKLDSDYPVVISNCSMDWLTDQGRYDPVFISSTSNKVYVTNCNIKNTCEVHGVDIARGCNVSYDAIIRAKHTVKCTFFNNGQLQMRPSFVPTTLDSCTFRSDGSVTMANQSVVRHNFFESSCLLTISSLAAGFPPNAVDSVHVNFNEFERVGDAGTIISVLNTDTIDVTKNYWGACTGPSTDQRQGRKARFDPFLRVRYPGTSYWLDIAQDKNYIIANGDDSVKFTFHFYEVLSGRDTSGAQIRYLFRILGDTLGIGAVTTDAQGAAAVVVKLPYQYRNAISLEVYLSATQCIDRAVLIPVIAPAGSDLEVLEASISQVTEHLTQVTAGKPFIVRAVISATEPVTTPFKVHAVVNGVVYDTFYVYKKQNVGISYAMENPLTQTTLPSSETPTIYIPIHDYSVQPGPFQVQVIIDPPDATHPKGLFEETNENNNVLVVTDTAFQTSWGNDGSANAKVFVQPIDNMPQYMYNRMQSFLDSTTSFLESIWPMKRGQVGFTLAPTMDDYSWINKDTLRMDTWEFYLMKAYKLMRTANPMYDRYVFAVGADWFGAKIAPFDYANQNVAPQTLSWSGIYDFMVASGQSKFNIAHDLGHSYGLRRADLDPADPLQEEEYVQEFIGTTIYDGIEAEVPRVIHAGSRNKADQVMRAHCFMGNAKLPSLSYNYIRWISDVEYGRLIDRQTKFTGFGQPSGMKAILVEGSVDSTNLSFDFGPWVKMEQAVYSSMVDSIYATHTFKFLDGTGKVLARYFYHPTFTSLGLDEGGENVHVKREYFAFVAPFSSDVKKVIVERGGTTVGERVFSDNAPSVTINAPTEQQNITADSIFTASWSATDPDGGSSFWYTVYLSTDNGSTWKLLFYESKDSVQKVLKLAQGQNYKLKIIANDGVNSSTEKVVTFNAVKSINAAEQPVKPGEFALDQNYPNPFNPSTTIGYNVGRPGQVTLTLLDMHGRAIRTLFSGFRSAGHYSLDLRADDLPSGVYVYRLEAAGTTMTKMLHLVK